MLFFEQIIALIITSTICAAIRDPVNYLPADISKSWKEIDPKLALNLKSEMGRCVGIITCKEVYDTVDVDMGIVANGFSAGAGVLQDLKSSKVQGILKNVADFAGNFHSYLSAFSSVASMIGVFGKSPGFDDVINVLKDGFRQMDKKFDALTLEIYDLKRLITKEHQMTRFWDSLSDLLSTNALVSRYLLKPSDETKKDLIDKWATVHDAIIELQASFDGTLGGVKLCSMMIDLTEVDRRKVLNSLIDLYRRMVQGVSHYVLIAKLKSRSDLSTITRLMVQRLRTVLNLISQCDKDIEDTKWQEM